MNKSVCIKDLSYEDFDLVFYKVISDKNIILKWKVLVNDINNFNYLVFLHFSDIYL